MMVNSSEIDDPIQESSSDEVVVNGQIALEEQSIPKTGSFSRPLATVSESRESNTSTLLRPRGQYASPDPDAIPLDLPNRLTSAASISRQQVTDNFMRWKKPSQPGAFNPINTLDNTTRALRQRQQDSSQRSAPRQATKRSSDLQEIGRSRKRNKLDSQGVEIVDSSSADELSKTTLSPGSQKASRTSRMPSSTDRAPKQKSNSYEVSQFEAVESRMSTKGYKGYHGTARPPQVSPQLPLAATGSRSRFFPRRSSPTGKDGEEVVSKEHQSSNESSLRSTPKQLSSHPQASEISEDELAELKVHQPSSAVPPSVWDIKASKRPSAEDPGVIRFPICSITTNERLDHAAKEMELVFNRRALIFDLCVEGDEEQESVFIANKVQRITSPDVNDSTEMRVETSKSEGRGYIIFIDCKSHKVHSDLIRLLIFASDAPCQKIDAQIFEKLKQTLKQQKSLRRLNQTERPLDIVLLQEKKRRRDSESKASTGEPALKKPREKLVHRLREEDSSSLQEGHTTQRENRRSGRHVLSELDTSKGSIDDTLDRLGLGSQKALATMTRVTRGSRQSQSTKAQEEVEGFPHEGRYSVAVGLGRKWKHPLVYPMDGKKRVTVEFDDLFRLDEGQCLNDNLVEFFLRYLRDKALKSEKSIYWFNTYFYSTLTKVKGKRVNFDGVRKWTRNNDLFTHDYVVVPINESAHWYVAIICNLPALRRVAPTVSDSEHQPADDAEPEDLDITTLHDGTRETSIQRSEFTKPGSTLKATAKGRHSGSLDTETSESFSNLSLDEPTPALEDVDNPGNMEEPINLVDSQSTTKTVKDVGVVVDIPTPQKPFAEAQNVAKEAGVSGSISAEKETPGSHNKRRKYGPIRDPDLPTIITLDSLGASHSPAIQALKLYLHEEASDKRGMTWDNAHIQGMTAKGIPQQDNFSDCGLYLLGYMQRFIENPGEFASKLLRKEFDEQEDWPKLRPSKMRSSIRDLLRDLHKEQESAKNEKRKPGTTTKNTEQPSEVQPQAPLEPTAMRENLSGASEDTKPVAGKTESKENTTIENTESGQLMERVSDNQVADSSSARVDPEGNDSGPRTVSLDLDNPKNVADTPENAASTSQTRHTAEEYTASAASSPLSILESDSSSKIPTFVQHKNVIVPDSQGEIQAEEESIDTGAKKDAPSKVTAQSTSDWLDRTLVTSHRQRNADIIDPTTQLEFAIAEESKILRKEHPTEDHNSTIVLATKSRHTPAEEVLVPAVVASATRSSVVNSKEGEIVGDFAEVDRRQVIAID